jgi:glycosyltransferase involved in cell wall biosynthesis
MTEQESPKVSVCMITYKHQEFISQALDSILSQKTSFPFEIVIGDDGSPDDTGKIAEAYALKYPGKIRYHRRDPNIGMMPNLIMTMEDCRGQYIAICEGDDYWTDENKLQEQANFLDTHPDYSFCCHNHFVLAKGKLIPANKNIKANKTVTTEEYMLHPFFHMASYFFRTEAMPRPFPDWYRNVLAGDHFLVLFLSMKGKIGYLNQRMSVFRNHGSSVSFTRTALDLKENFVNHLELFDQYSSAAYHQPLQRVISRWDLVYKVYEPVSYLGKIGYLFRHLGVYSRNFRATGRLKLLVKYLVPQRILRKVKG